MIFKSNCNLSYCSSRCWELEILYSWHMSIPYTWERMDFIDPYESTCWKKCNIKSYWLP